jgi:hypothetical protein
MMKTRKSVVQALVGMVVLVGLLGMQPRYQPLTQADALRSDARGATDVTVPAQPAGRAVAPSPAGGQPMFVENVGQFDDGARFQVSQGLGGNAWLADDAIWLRLVAGREAPQPSIAPGQEPEAISAGLAADVKIGFVGANPRPRLVPFDRLETTISFFTGRSAQDWHPAVPVWGGVRYEGLWPGVDLEISGGEGGWAWRAIADDAAALEQVRLQVEGADGLYLEGQPAFGLRLATPLGDLHMPLLGVEVPGGSLVLQPTRLEGRQVAWPFALDGSLPQAAVTDPAAATDDADDLLYSTYLGYDEYEVPWDMAVDPAGNAYVAGWVPSADFPTTPGTRPYAGDDDAFAVKLKPDGSGLVFATFWGGTDQDWGETVAVDRSGLVYLAGNTRSADFPVTTEGYDQSYSGSGDVYLSVLSADAQSVLYSTYLGGLWGDSAYDLVLDGSAAWLAGSTSSADWPTINAFDTSLAGSTDCFVAKLIPNDPGSDLKHSTYLGGDGYDRCQAIVYAGGELWAAGTTDSASGFPTTTGDYDRTHNGGYDAFVVNLWVSGGLGMFYGTYLGGSLEDQVSGLVVDGRNAVVVGYTYSPDYPTAGIAYDPGFSGTSEAFVTALDAGGDALIYSTLLHPEYCTACQSLATAIDLLYGKPVIVGQTNSDRYSTAVWSYDSTYGGGGDLFILYLEADGSAVLDSTYLGGSGGDDTFVARPLSAAATAEGVFVLGNTQSADFPTTLGAYDRTLNGDGDIFVSRLSIGQPALGNFALNRDAYSFENPAGTPITGLTLQSLLGDDCFCKWKDGVCQRSRSANRIYDFLEDTWGHGRCRGMSVTALRFFQGDDSPANYQPAVSTTYQLTPTREVLDNIQLYHYTQYFEPASKWTDLYRDNNLPHEIVADLAWRLERYLYQEPYAMSLQWEDPVTGDKAGHSIIPYKVDMEDTDKYRIWVYDSNWPDSGPCAACATTNRHVNVNAATDYWSYNMGCTVAGCGRVNLWHGDADTESMSMVPLDQDTTLPVDCPGANWWTRLWDWVQGDARLLVTDSLGRRLGYVDNQEVDEIPDGYLVVPMTGGGLEPIYNLPASDDYSILIDGQTLTETQSNSVTQFGPGYAAWVDEMLLSPTSRDQLTIATDGSQLVYQPNEARRVTLGQTADDGPNSYEINFRGVNVAAGLRTGLRHDAAERTFALNNSAGAGGSYDLALFRVGSEGEQQFYHAGVPISAGDTHLVDYDGWGGELLMVQIDEGSNGTVDDTLELANEAGPRVYLPVVMRSYRVGKSNVVDPAGDWLPGAVQLASTDILAASAERRLTEGVMVLTLKLAGDLPQTLPADQRNRWVWLLDTDMNPDTGEPWYDIGAEYEVNLHIQSDGFYVDVRDWYNNWTPVPAAGTIDGNTATVRIPVSYLGGATRFDWMTVVEPFDRTGYRFDIAPNSGHAELP